LKTSCPSAQDPSQCNGRSIEGNDSLQSIYTGILATVELHLNGGTTATAVSGAQLRLFVRNGAMNASTFETTFKALPPNPAPVSVVDTLNDGRGYLPAAAGDYLLQLRWIDPAGSPTQVLYGAVNVAHGDFPAAPANSPSIVTKTLHINKVIKNDGTIQYSGLQVGTDPPLVTSP
jgi:hypothetical protein